MFTFLLTHLHFFYTALNDLIFSYLYNCEKNDDYLIINYYVDGQKFTLFKRKKQHVFGEHCISAISVVNDKEYDFTQRFNEINGYNNWHNVIQEFYPLEIFKTCLPELYDAHLFPNSMRFIFEDGSLHNEIF